MPGYFLANYNTATTFYFPMVKRAVVDLAATADWTPVNSDCNISKDGGAQANPTNNVAISTGTTWKITLSATELSAKEINLMVVDAATKAVEDQWLTIKTYGNASAFFQSDPTLANLPANLTQLLGTAVATPATAGVLDVNLKNVNNVVVNNQQAQFGANAIQVSGTGLTARDIGASVLLSNGTGAGQVQLSAGNVTVQTLANNAITEISINANAFSGVKFANNVSIQTVTGNVGNVTSNIGGNVAGSVGSVTGNVAAVTGNIGGSLAGSVGSVTGNVAAVTGNIGGNVAGTVASVTGNVNAVTTNIGGNVAGTVGSVTGNVAAVTGSVGGSVAGSVGSVVAAVAITSNIKKNQALAGFEFLMTDSTNHAPLLGATVSVTRSIDGAAFGAGTLSAVTEVSNGMYSVDFGAGDLNGKTIVLRATAVGADDTFERIVTQP